MVFRQAGRRLTCPLPKTYWYICVKAVLRLAYPLQGCKWSLFNSKNSSTVRLLFRKTKMFSTSESFGLVFGLEIDALNAHTPNVILLYNARRGFHNDTGGDGTRTE